LSIAAVRRDDHDVDLLGGITPHSEYGCRPRGCDVYTQCFDEHDHPMISAIPGNLDGPIGGSA
jgi:hypothetical protein